jgi:hypothetical protein
MAPSRSTSSAASTANGPPTPELLPGSPPHHRRRRPSRSGLPTPLNGRKTNPPSPRDQRAIQYSAYPDWPFDRLREMYPDGRYEAGADIGHDEWTNLKIDIHNTHLNILVNGTQSAERGRDQGDTRYRCRRPVRRHGQRVLLLQPDNQSSLKPIIRPQLESQLWSSPGHRTLTTPHCRGPYSKALHCGDGPCRRSVH